MCEDELKCKHSDVPVCMYACVLTCPREDKELEEEKQRLKKKEREARSKTPVHRAFGFVGFISQVTLST